MIQKGFSYIGLRGLLIKIVYISYDSLSDNTGV